MRQFYTGLRPKLKYVKRENSNGKYLLFSCPLKKIYLLFLNVFNIQKLNLIKEKKSI